MNQTSCQLCAFRGCDADWCRHGARQSDSGYSICNGTGAAFDPRVLKAIQLDQPLYHALVFEPGVWEPSVCQVESRLDHRLTVSYGSQGSAHLVLPDLEALSVQTPDQVPTLPAFVSLAEVPGAIQRAVRALVEKCGFCVQSAPNPDALIRTITVERTRPIVKSSRYGTVISFTYGVDIKGTPVTPCYEG